jgi:predicted ATPase
LQWLLVSDRSQAQAARLVTLTGSGGCGKTRLGIQVAGRVSDNFADGVWFADLSSISDPALVPTTVLSVLRGHESSDQKPLETLLRHLNGRKLLLVLDNCEHLAEACAEFVETLLASTSELRVMATSREALHVPGEIAWRVPSLETPAPASRVEPDQLLKYEAVKLFVDRVLQTDPSFSVRASNAAALVQLCSRLDGIPLALELAAARAAGMSVHEIAARLDDCFQLLTGGSRTAPMRHRTLRATVDWSHDLLSPAEQTLFRRLAVFAGGWTLEAAETVCEGEPLPRSEILDLLMRLIDQSLVSVQAEDGRTRYRFLETVRAYAAERLEAARETTAVQARHRDWCLTFAERAAEGLRSPDPLAWFRQVSVEHDNIRAAIDSCGLDPTTTETELRLAAAMGAVWYPRMPGEGRRRLDAALKRAPATPSSARAEALIWQALFERNFGDPAVGRELAREAASDARAAGDLA